METTPDVCETERQSQDIKIKKQKHKMAADIDLIERK